MKFLLCFFSIVFSFHSFSQELKAENGWYLPTKGTLRVLVIFAEIEHDVHPEKEPFPEGSDYWKPHQLPEFKDDLFEPIWTDNPKAMLTNYYAECSFNQFKVLGDHFFELIKVKESEVKLWNFNDVSNKILEKINAYPQFKTAHNLKIEDFDLWHKKRQPGSESTEGADNPISFDHVMLIMRNYSTWGNSGGSTSPGSFGKIFGYESDTRSQFNEGKLHPFSILRHEFNHLLFGGNNFHNGGGLGAGAGYFIPSQGGWSMMGGAHSSFETCNAWDRDRMNWKPENKQFTIGAINASNGKEVNTDFDGNIATSQTLILRDFVTSGDAVRIKLPYLDETEFEQWIWIENHQTTKNNGSRFDQFQWHQDECTEDAQPGIYMYLQVDKNTKTGSGIFGGEGDYLRPICADGFYDIELVDEEVQNLCVSWTKLKPFIKKEKNKNVLTGSQDQERAVFDFNQDGKIARKEEYPQYLERVNGVDEHKLTMHGRKRHAFTVEEKNIVNISTNPAPFPMYTLVSLENPLTQAWVKNNRRIWLNGIQIKLLENLPDGSIKIKVDFNQTAINQDVNWKADSILLPKIESSNGFSLYVEEGKKVILSRGKTPTRISNPEEFKKEMLFTSPTKMYCLTGSSIKLEEGAEIIVEDESILTFKNGSYLELEPKAKINVQSGKIVVEPQAKMNLKRQSKIIFTPSSEVKFPETDYKLKKVWFGKGKRVLKVK